MDTNTKLCSLFHQNRFPSGVLMLLLILYVPFGLLLALFRVCFCLQLFLFLSILPKESVIKRILLRVSGAVVGFVITQEGKDNLSKDGPKVIISNHVTALDHVAIETLIPSTMHMSMVRCPRLVQWLLSYSDFGGAKEKENINNKIKEFLAESASPLLVFPEDAITSGSTGLLKFNPWVFELSDTILPVVISVSRPLVTRISPSVLGSGWWGDLFWTIFVPYTNFHIRVLPPVSRAEQTVGEFCQKAQQCMAASLGLEVTKFTAQDKATYEKQLRAEEVQQTIAQALEGQKTTSNGASNRQPRDGNKSCTPGSSVETSPNRNTRLTRLIEQVKEVLPQVPANAIRRDLSRTHCVDRTITNILEGRVKYIPETSGQQKETPKSVGTPAKTKTTTTPFSPENRQRTLEERKQMMFEDARRRYKEKFGT